MIPLLVDIVEIFLGLGIGIYSIIFLVLFKRLVVALEKIANKPGVTETTIGTTPSIGVPKPQVTQRSVGDLPPEITAPHISKPPRPRGGFGTKASPDETTE